MGIQIPPEIAWAVSWAAGGDWPKPDEDHVRAIGAVWKGASQELDRVAAEVDPVTARVLGSVKGAAATAFSSFTSRLRQTIPSMASAADDIGTMSVNTALQVEYAKYMILAQSAWLAAEIVALASSFYGSALIPAEITAVRINVQLILRRAFTAVVSAAVTQAAMDAAVQGIQFLKGDRTEWDAKSTALGAAMGGMGAAIGMPISLAGSALAPKLSNTVVGHAVTGAVSGVAVGAATNAAFDAGQDLGLAAGAGAIGGAAGWRHRPGGASATGVEKVEGVPEAPKLSQDVSGEVTPLGRTTDGASTGHPSDEPVPTEAAPQADTAPTTGTAPADGTESPQIERQSAEAPSTASQPSRTEPRGDAPVSGSAQAPDAAGTHAPETERAQTTQDARAATSTAPPATIPLTDGGAGATGRTTPTASADTQARSAMTTGEGHGNSGSQQRDETTTAATTATATSAETASQTTAGDIETERGAGTTAPATATRTSGPATDQPEQHAAGTNPAAPVVPTMSPGHAETPSTVGSHADTPATVGSHAGTPATPERQAPTTAPATSTTSTSSATVEASTVEAASSSTAASPASPSVPHSVPEHTTGLPGMDPAAKTAEQPASPHLADTVFRSGTQVVEHSPSTVPETPSAARTDPVTVVAAAHQLGKAAGEPSPGLPGLDAKGTSTQAVQPERAPTQAVRAVAEPPVGGTPVRLGSTGTDAARPLPTVAAHDPAAHSPLRTAGGPPRTGEPATASHGATTNAPSEPRTTTSAAPPQQPTHTQSAAEPARHAVPRPGSSEPGTEGSAAHAHPSADSNGQPLHGEPPQGKHHDDRQDPPDGGGDPLPPHPRSDDTTAAHPTSSRLPEYIPAPEHAQASPEQQRHWEQAQRELHGAYDTHLTEAARVAGERAEVRARLDAAFTQWSSRLPEHSPEEFAVAVRRRAEEVVRAELSAEPESRERILNDLHGRLELAAVREAAVRVGMERFERTVDVASRQLTAPGEEFGPQPALSREMVDRAREHLSGVFRDRAEKAVAETYRTPDDVGEALPERTVQGERALDGLTAALPRDLDLRVGFETALDSADRAVEHTAGTWRNGLDAAGERLLEQTGVAADAGVSQESLRLLRTTLREQVESDFTAVFSSVDSADGFHGSPQDAVADFNGRFEQRLQELRRQFAVQAAREAAIRAVLDTVHEAAGVWHEQGLHRLDKATAETFGLSGPVPERLADRVAAELARGIDGRLLRTRDADMDTWGTSFGELAASDRIHDLITLHSAREHGFRTAEGQAHERVAAWREGHTLSDDAAERVREGHSERVRDAFDELFPAPDALHGDGVAERLQRWRETRQALDDDLAVHLAFESEVMPALEGAARGFDAFAADKEPIPFAELSDLKERYGEEWFTAYREHWGPDGLDADKWLAHEAAHENTFRVADGDEPAEHGSAQSLSPLDGGRAPIDGHPEHTGDTVSSALAPVTPGGRVSDFAAPDNWMHRSDNAPSALLRSERFDPASSPLDPSRFPGTLSGAQTLIRAQVRRIQADNGTWVRDHTVALPLRLDHTVTPHDLTTLNNQLQASLDAHVNTGYALPRSGDQLHVTLHLVHDDHHPEHILLSRTPTPGPTDQRHWNLPEDRNDAAPLPEFTHEVLHYLGLPDEYLQENFLFRLAKERPAVHSDDALMVQADRFTPLPERYLTVIENTVDANTVLRDHPLTPRSENDPVQRNHDPAADPTTDRWPTSHSPDPEESSSGQSHHSVEQLPTATQAIGIRKDPFGGWRLDDETPLTVDDRSGLKTFVEKALRADASTGDRLQARILLRRLEQLSLGRHPTDPITEQISQEQRTALGEVHQEVRQYYESALASAPPVSDGVLVPKKVHFVWFGKPMTPYGMANVLRWADHISRANEKLPPGKQWDLNLWTDPKYNARGSKGDWGRATERLRKAGVTVHTDTAEKVAGAGRSVQERYRQLDPDGTQGLTGLPDLGQIYRTGLKQGAFNLGSDIARYAVLAEQGGVYADVDLGPGQVSFETMPDIRLRLDDVPLLSPGLRDLSSLLKELRDLGRRAQTGSSESGGPITPEDLLVAAGSRYEKGQLGNHFIVAPPNSDFINLLNEKIPQKFQEFSASSSKNGPDLTREAAAISGPGLIHHVRQNQSGSALGEYVGDVLGLWRAEPAADWQTPPGLRSRDLVALFDPQVLRTWAGLEWVTEESAHQLDPMQQPVRGDAPTTSTSGGRPTADVGAAPTDVSGVGDSEIIDRWRTLSALPRARRSDALRSVDTAVDAWANGGRRLRGDHETSQRQLGAILDAVEAWKSGKNGPSDRIEAVDRLTAHVQSQLRDLHRRIAERAQAEEPSVRERGAADVRPPTVPDPVDGPPSHEADRWPTSHAPEGPSGESFRATEEIAFGEGSKRPGEDQLAKIKDFSDSVAAEAVRRVTHDEKPLRVYVEGGGNGSKWGSLRGTSNLADSGLERARAVWEVLRSRLNEEISRLWSGDPDILTGTSLLQAPRSRGQGESAAPFPETPVEPLTPAEARAARRTVRIWAADDGPARVLRLLAHDRTQLDADRREALFDYVDESARRGQDARVRLLLRRLELQNLHVLRGELDSRYAERVAEIALPAGALTPVPKDVHFFWIGEEPSAGALDNLEAWARSGGGRWQQHLWTDATFAEWSGPVRTRLEQIVTVHQDSLDALRIADRPQVLEVYDAAVANGAYNLVSDIARYVILERFGGVYADVDLHPGTVVLSSMAEITMRSEDLPLLAPRLRDMDSVADALAAAGADAPADRMEQVDLAARLRWDAGVLGNHLIVAPPGSEFITSLLEAIPKNFAALREHMVVSFTDASQFPKELKNLAPQISGPGMIVDRIPGSEGFPPLQRFAMKAGAEGVAAFDGSSYPTFNRNEAIALFSPRALEAFQGIRWVTAESERQLDAPAVEQSAAGPSVGMAPLHVPEAPSDAPAPTRPARQVPLPADPSTWVERRKEVPEGYVGHLRVERFDPAVDAMSRHRAPGTLAGAQTLMRSGVSRIQAENGTWVRDHVVTLPVRLAGSGLSEHDLAGFQVGIQGALDKHINEAGYALPRSGDQFHVELRLVHDDGHPEHVIVSRSDDPARSDQRHWNLGPPTEDHRYLPVVFHEVFHYLGLPDEYRDPEFVFRRNADSVAVRSDGFMVSTARLAPLPERYLAAIEDSVDASVVMHGYALRDPAADGDRPGAGASSQQDGWLSAADWESRRWDTAPSPRPDGEDATHSAVPSVRAADDSEIIDRWRTESALPRVRRSDTLRRIDTAVDEWANGGRKLPGDHDTNQRQLGAVRDAVEAWKSGKNGPSDRAEAVDRLTAHVQSAWDDLHQRIAERAHQAQLRDRYARIHPEVSAFAGRRLPQQVDPANNTTHHIFTGDRTPHGALSDDALEAADDLSRRQLAAKRDTAAAGGVTVDAGVSADRLRELMDGARNELTGSTLHPELNSYLDRADQAEALDTGSHLGNLTPVVENVRGTQVTVHGDPTDSLLEARIVNFRKAVTTVQEAGFHVPDVELHLPKYGRLLEVHEDRIVEQSAGRLQRAEYLAPNAVIASPDVVGNPLTSKLADDRYRYLSTELDPSGVGTMVHELGHFLHYANARAQYHDLAFTQFAGRSGQDGDAVPHQALALGVSAYAAGNPREFVAEVFTGLVYGKPFSPEVMRMYHGLGGPTPTPDRAPSVTLPSAEAGLDRWQTSQSPTARTADTHHRLDTHPASAPEKAPEEIPLPPSPTGAEGPSSTRTGTELRPHETPLPDSASESDTASQQSSTAEHSEGSESVSERPESASGDAEEVDSYGRAPATESDGESIHPADSAPGPLAAPSSERRHPWYVDHGAHGEFDVAGAATWDRERVDTEAAAVAGALTGLPGSPAHQQELRAGIERELRELFAADSGEQWSERLRAGHMAEVAGQTVWLRPALREVTPADGAPHPVGAVQHQVYYGSAKVSSGAERETRNAMNAALTTVLTAGATGLSTVAGPVPQLSVGGNTKRSDTDGFEVVSGRKPKTTGATDFAAQLHVEVSVDGEVAPHDTVTPRGLTVRFPEVFSSAQEPRPDAVAHPMRPVSPDAPHLTRAPLTLQAMDTGPVVVGLVRELRRAGIPADTLAVLMPKFIKELANEDTVRTRSRFWLTTGDSSGRFDESTSAMRRFTGRFTANTVWERAQYVGTTAVRIQEDLGLVTNDKHGRATTGEGRIGGGIDILGMSATDNGHLGNLSVGASAESSRTVSLAVNSSRAEHTVLTRHEDHARYHVQARVEVVTHSETHRDVRPVQATVATEILVPLRAAAEFERRMFGEVVTEALRPGEPGTDPVGVDAIAPPQLTSGRGQGFGKLIGLPGAERVYGELRRQLDSMMAELRRQPSLADRSRLETLLAAHYGRPTLEGDLGVVLAGLDQRLTIGGESFDVSARLHLLDRLEGTGTYAMTMDGKAVSRAGMQAQRSHGIGLSASANGSAQLKVSDRFKVRVGRFQVGGSWNRATGNTLSAESKNHRRTQTTGLVHELAYGAVWEVSVHHPKADAHWWIEDQGNMAAVFAVPDEHTPARAADLSPSPEPAPAGEGYGAVRTLTGWPATAHIPFEHHSGAVYPVFLHSDELLHAAMEQYRRVNGLLPGVLRERWEFPLELRRSMNSSALHTEFDALTSPDGWHVQLDTHKNWKQALRLRLRAYDPVHHGRPDVSIERALQGKDRTTDSSRSGYGVQLTGQLGVHLRHADHEVSASVIASGSASRQHHHEAQRGAAGLTRATYAGPVHTYRSDVVMEVTAIRWKGGTTESETTYLHITQGMDSLVPHRLVSDLGLAVPEHVQERIDGDDGTPVPRRGPQRLLDDGVTEVPLRRYREPTLGVLTGHAEQLHAARVLTHIEQVLRERGLLPRDAVPRPNLRMQALRHRFSEEALAANLPALLGNGVHAWMPITGVFGQTHFVSIRVTAQAFEAVEHWTRPETTLMLGGERSTALIEKQVVATDWKVAGEAENRGSLGSVKFSGGGEAGWVNKSSDTRGTSADTKDVFRVKTREGSQEFTHPMRYRVEISVAAQGPHVVHWMGTRVKDGVLALGSLSSRFLGTGNDVAAFWYSHQAGSWSSDSAAEGKMIDGSLRTLVPDHLTSGQPHAQVDPEAPLIDPHHTLGKGVHWHTGARPVPGPVEAELAAHLLPKAVPASEAVARWAALTTLPPWQRPGDLGLSDAWQVPGLGLDSKYGMRLRLYATDGALRAHSGELLGHTYQLPLRDGGSVTVGLRVVWAQQVAEAQFKDRSYSEADDTPLSVRNRARGWEVTGRSAASGPGAGGTEVRGAGGLSYGRVHGASEEYEAGQDYENNVATSRGLRYYGFDVEAFLIGPYGTLAMEVPGGLYGMLPTKVAEGLHAAHPDVFHGPAPTTEAKGKAPEAEAFDDLMAGWEPPAVGSSTAAVRHLADRLRDAGLVEGRSPIRLRAGDTSHAVDLAREATQSLGRPIHLILDTGIEKRIVPSGMDRSGAATPTGSVGLPSGTAQDTDPARSEAAPAAVVTEVSAPETDPPTLGT
ncbi:glycosyltransferase [Streptomyces sp. NPDC057579]|uniref:WXG100-like domain-containing protein n=1 Tax=Streptomyces sp. NPDC057579 TaxID=3346172 RepID=UPI00368B7FD8